MVILRGDPLVGSSNLPSRIVFFFLTNFASFQVSVLRKTMVTSVHSTRVVFIPSKDKIRVRVPMDAHGGLLYMVAYNLRKVENRDRYPDPPFASNRRNSLVAGLRVVAAAAWVRFPVSAFGFNF